MRKLLGILPLMLFVACTPQKEAGTTAYVAVTGVSISGVPDGPLKYGQTCQLKAVVDPSNAANKKVTWASDSEDVATVDDTGLVTAKNNGSATITVTTENMNKTASCIIEVGSSWVTDIAVVPESVSMRVGSTPVTLKVSFTPENPDDKTVTFEKASGDCFEVSKEGVVTAVKVGSGSIKVTAKGTRPEGDPVVATVPVTVSAQAIYPTSIEVELGSLAMTLNEKQTPKITLKPDNVTEKDVTATSSRPDVIEVNPETFELTAKAQGSADITFRTVNDLSKVVTVEVKQIFPTSFTVNGMPTQMIVGEKATPTYVFEPEDVTEKGVTITSSAPSILAVSGGTLTAKSNGNAVVTFTTANNLTKTVRVAVWAGGPKVVVKTPSGSNQQFYGGSMSLCVGESYTFQADVSNTNEKTLKWSVTEGSGYASINESTGVLNCTAGPTSSSTATVKVKAALASNPDVCGEYSFTVWRKTSQLNPDEAKLGVGTSYTDSKKYIYIKKTRSLTFDASVFGSNGRPTFSFSSGHSSVKVTQNYTAKTVTISTGDASGIVKTTLTVTALDNTSLKKTINICLCDYDKDDIKIGDYLTNIPSSGAATCYDGGYRGGGNSAPEFESVEYRANTSAILFYVHSSATAVAASDSQAPLKSFTRSGAESRHGMAVDIRDAVDKNNAALSVKFSEDKDDISASSNYPSGYVKPNVSGKYAYDFTAALAVYNSKRGSTHQVKPVQALSNGKNNSIFLLPTPSEFEYLSYSMNVVNKAIAQLKSKQSKGEAISTSTKYWTSQTKNASTAEAMTYADGMWIAVSTDKGTALKVRFIYVN